MASLPSALVGNTLKLEPHFKKQTPTSFSFDKRNCSNISQLDKGLDSFKLELKEAISLVPEGNVVGETSAYLTLLHECMHKNSLSEVLEIHAHILKTGTHQDLFIMTSLVNVYAKCGRMESARKVFDNMPERNVVSWTSLMSGYAYNSQSELAIRVFGEMLEVGGYPTNYTLAVVLNACSSTSNFEFGKQLHGYSIKYQAAGYTSVGNTLFGLYSGRGDLRSAIKAFQMIDQKDVISWTSVISACGDYGHSAAGVDFFVQMISDGVEPNEFTLTSVLSSCCVMRAWDVGSQVHTLSIKLGYGSSYPVMNSLMYLYLKSGGSMESARKLFDNLPKRNLDTWTPLMSGYVYNSKPELAISVFVEMLEVGGYPTSGSLAVVLKACSLLSNFEFVEQLHGYIIKYQSAGDKKIGSSLCSLYSKRGVLHSAINAFQMIDQNDVVSWTNVVSACGDNGHSAAGVDFFVQMISDGVEPNVFTLTSVLSLCSDMQALDVGLQVHALSIKLGYGSSFPVMDSLRFLYLKSGLLREAMMFFDAMENISLVTWNAMIAGHARAMNIADDSVSAHCNGIQALEIFKRLNRSGLKPDLFTYSSVLTVCSSLAALDQGEQVHAQTIKSGFLSDVVVGTSLVNMYSKCGSIHRASKAFVEMPTRTLISWSSMINCLAQHGQSRQALQLFEEMEFLGIKPNMITFVGILAACSHAGMVEEALAYFEMMKSEYKIRPVMDHYACLIDMFVRLGRLDEAFDLVKEMEFEPNEVIWSILIAGCRSQGKLDLGFYAAEKLLSLNPRDPETCYLLLNMYLSAERWQDVSRVRKMMKAENIGKMKDWSWISIKETVYSFKADDPRHAAGEINQLLEELHERAKALGYELQTCLDVMNDEDEGTTVSNVHHSEKLAVAFGLLNTSKGTAIRIKKSISMCKDCHDFLKFISISTARRIIVRDRKSLHRFDNGKCSCGDFSSLIS